MTIDDFLKLQQTIKKLKEYDELKAKNDIKNKGTL